MSDEVVPRGLHERDERTRDASALLRGAVIMGAVEAAFEHADDRVLFVGQ